MAKSKMRPMAGDPDKNDSLDKVESVRLSPPELEWLNAWCKRTAQDRSSVLRAAARLLKVVVSDLTLEATVELIAQLASKDRESVAAERDIVWAAMAARMKPLTPSPHRPSKQASGSRSDQDR